MTNTAALVKSAHVHIYSAHAEQNFQILTILSALTTILTILTRTIYKYSINIYTVLHSSVYIFSDLINSYYSCQ